MKKILTILSLALLLISCSTDDSLQSGDTLSSAKYAPKGSITSSVLNPKYIFPCWTNSTAHYDNVGSFAYPKWAFIADVPADATPGALYKVTLEIQEIEPENLEVGIGNIIQFTDNVIYNNITVTPPSVARYPYQLLLYYRWRLKISQISSKDYSTIICSQSTPWYDTPLG